MEELTDEHFEGQMRIAVSIIERLSLTKNFAE